MPRKPHQVGIPLLHPLHLVAVHALANLHERMLDVARLGFIVQILGQFGIAERRAKPGAMPEQKRHQHNDPSYEKEEQAIAARHLATRLDRRFHGCRGRGGHSSWIIKEDVSWSPLGWQVGPIFSDPDERSEKRPLLSQSSLGWIGPLASLGITSWKRFSTERHLLFDLRIQHARLI